MKNKHLSKENKLKSLEFTLETITVLSTVQLSCNGICGLLRKAIKSECHVNDLFYCDQIKLYIPEFTLTNARRLSSRYGYKSPRHDAKMDEFWWNNCEFSGRIGFLKALIEQIKNEK